MNDAIIFWIAKPVAEMLIVLGIVFLVIVASIAASIPRVIRQLRCGHERVHETGSCDAICSKCGKNLGFIGTWRKNRAAAAIGKEMPNG